MYACSNLMACVVSICCLQDGEKRSAALQQQVAAFAASAAITAAALVNPLPAAADLVQVGTWLPCLMRRSNNSKAVGVCTMPLLDLAVVHTAKERS
jgi:hypothetical protein